jgi:hypothetical protein
MQMPTFSSTKTLATLLCSLAIVACGPPAEADRTKSGPIVGPFVVSDFFTPSGLMGDGEIPGRVSEGIDENCKMPRPPGAQGDCYHFLWRADQDKPEPLDAHWMGAYWVYPSNSWGTVPGRALQPPLDLGPDGKGGELHGYKRVRFWAAVDVLPNPPILRYFVGGINGPSAKPPQPYSDQGCQIFAGDDTTDPPTPRTVSCDVGVFMVGNPQDLTLTTTWQQFSLDISNWGLTSLIGAFGFSMNDTENPSHVVSLYIDDVVWDAQ